jgi:two-component sensor histidine kinase
MSLGASAATPDGAPLRTEENRLAALRALEILDTPPEPEFDDLAALAADLTGAPAAFVSLVDAERQWFKARTAPGPIETPRSWSFCDHLLRAGAGEVLVVPDAATDLRFQANPLVLGGPRIRFYAGAPLVTAEGLVLGALCVTSPEPRPGGLGDAERRRLASLAGLVTQALALRAAALRAARAKRDTEARRAREERLRLSLTVAGACAWELDPASGMSTWDPSARILLGLPERIAFGDALNRLVHRDDVERLRAAVAGALDPAGDGRYSVEHRTAAPRADGRPRWLRSLGQAWFEAGPRGTRRPTRLVCVTMDITEERAAAERQLLFVAELNHRVKNTLAIVQAIAEGTRRASAQGAGDAVISGFHADFQRRLLALARAHDLLTREAWEGAALADLAAAAVCAVAPSMPAECSGASQVVIAGPMVRLRPEPAVALAMAFHELATNAARHGALSCSSGQVAVEWRVLDNGTALELTWTETGGPRLVGPPVHRGFGMRLLERALGRQLRGQVELDFAPGTLNLRARVPMSLCLPQD